jgi:hypothetical protein
MQNCKSASDLRLTAEQACGNFQAPFLTLMPHSFSPSAVFGPNASYWWWYRTATEGAAASV